VRRRRRRRLSIYPIHVRSSQFSVTFRSTNVAMLVGDSTISHSKYVIPFSNGDWSPEQSSMASDEPLEALLAAK